jgi:glycosyltransferase involved in cell wall biosynthesis
LPEQKRILFLYTELAGYFLACVGELIRQSGAEVHIVRWPLNSEAPFQFSGDNNISFYDRHQLTDESLTELVDKINPHLIYCSGWIDKGYVKISRQWKNKIPVVAGIDTQWNGSLKQQVHRLISPFTVKRNFSHLWVAGEPQKIYAKKLGFPEDKILKGVYSADVPWFENLYHQFHSAKAAHFPKRFVFVGRYLEFKGIFDLWKAFLATLEEQPHDWELWCLGTGEAWDQRIQHEKIKHLGFVQPADMANIIGQTGVFILPSHFEPWAVAVHEFAAAGFPLICSDQVGAVTQFMEEEKNGFIFGSGKVEKLREVMLRFIQMDTKRLNEMGDWSHHMALSLTPVTWARTLLALT